MCCFTWCVLLTLHLVFNAPNLPVDRYTDTSVDVGVPARHVVFVSFIFVSGDVFFLQDVPLQTIKMEMFKQRAALLQVYEDI